MMPVRWAGVQQYVGLDDSSTLVWMTAVRWAVYSGTLSSVLRYAVQRTSVRPRAYCHKDRAFSYRVPLVETMIMKRRGRQQFLFVISAKIRCFSSSMGTMSNRLFCERRSVKWIGCTAFAIMHIHTKIINRKFGYPNNNPYLCNGFLSHRTSVTLKWQ